MSSAAQDYMVETPGAPDATLITDGDELYVPSKREEVAEARHIAGQRQSSCSMLVSSDARPVLVVRPRL